MSNRNSLLANLSPCMRTPAYTQPAPCLFRTPPVGRECPIQTCAPHSDLRQTPGDHYLGTPWSGRERQLKRHPPVWCAYRQTTSLIVPAKMCPVVSTCTQNNLLVVMCSWWTISRPDTAFTHPRAPAAPLPVVPLSLLTVMRLAGSKGGSIVESELFLSFGKLQ